MVLDNDVLMFFFQYEREIERLKCSVELLRGRLPAEPGQDHTDAKMKAIISR